MSMGADPSLATVPMHTTGTPAGGSDGNYIRTFLTDAAGRLFIVETASNGTSQEAVTNNVDLGAIITAAASTATIHSPDQTNYNGRGVKVVLNMTAVGTGSVTITIEGKDPASGTYYTILSGVAVTGNGTTVYTVYPGVTASNNVSASDVLPRTWRVTATANNANAATYTVGASLVN